MIAALENSPRILLFTSGVVDAPSRSLLSLILEWVEVRDSPNGIFGPWAWWSRGLARWESSWDVAAAVVAVVAVIWKSPGKDHFNSFSFRAWIGLIWEISPRKLRQSSWNFGPRLFWKKYNVSKFQEMPKYKAMHIFSKMDMSAISRNVYFSEIKAPAGAS